MKRKFIFTKRHIGAFQLVKDFAHSSLKTWVFFTFTSYNNVRTENPVIWRKIQNPRLNGWKWFNTLPIKALNENVMVDNKVKTSPLMCEWAFSSTLEESLLDFRASELSSFFFQLIVGMLNLALCVVENPVHGSVSSSSSFAILY